MAATPVGVCASSAAATAVHTDGSDHERNTHRGVAATVSSGRAPARTNSRSPNQKRDWELTKLCSSAPALDCKFKRIERILPLPHLALIDKPAGGSSCSSRVRQRWYACRLAVARVNETIDALNDLDRSEVARPPTVQVHGGCSVA